MPIDFFYHRPVSIPLGKGEGAPRLHFEIFPTIDTEMAFTGRGIPENMRFERCLRNELCWPLRLKDFMNYLRFEEHSAENLKFFLWYQDYVSRWEKLPQDQKDLSPEWNKEASKDKDKDRSSNLEDAAKVSVEALNARNSFQQQPFRAEVFRIASLFLATRGPLEINLSTWERQRTIEALSYTTHPSAFLPVAQATEHVLRYQSYPNLLLRQLCLRRRNKYRLMVGYFNVGFFLMVGIVGAVVLILSPFHRAWRLIPGFAFWIGSAVLFACWRGICAILFVRRETLLDPWDDPEEFATRTSGKKRKEDTKDDGEKEDEAKSNGKDPPYRIVPGGFPRHPSHHRKRSSVTTKDGLSRLEAHEDEDVPDKEDVISEVSSGSCANEVYFDDVDVKKAEARMASWQRRSFYGKAMTDYAKIREAELRTLLVTMFAQNCVMGVLPTVVFLAVVMPIPSYGVLFC